MANETRDESTEGESDGEVDDSDDLDERDWFDDENAHDLDDYDEDDLDDEDELANSSGDGDAPEDRLPEVAPQLRRYARDLSKASASLAGALDDYAGRVESAARGELPAGAAQPPESLTPDLVARELTPSRLAGMLELVRNVLIFMPVLWTWFEIGRAAEAYSAFLTANEGTAAASQSFLHVWQTGFGGHGGALTFNLTTTAWGAAGLILALVVFHLLATMARSENGRARERRAADFAALLSRAAALRPPERPETPQQQLEEFARAGLSLSTQLADLSVTFGQRMAPLAESLSAAERAMAGMSDLVRHQAEQMAEVTKSLAEVAAISRRLEAVEASMTRSSVALEGMQNRLAPATEELVAGIKGFTRTADLVARATD
ncbi:MAG: hypothetical protein O3B31_11315, partial [Chloroflexi bacterium]|nr:hypothetical protein [Chloroflexota bacterium]